MKSLDKLRVKPAVEPAKEVVLEVNTDDISERLLKSIDDHLGERNKTEFPFISEWLMRRYTGKYDIGVIEEKERKRKEKEDKKKNKVLVK